MPDGLVSHRSAFGPAETLDRVLAAVRGHSLEVFITIDHAKAAADVGLTLGAASLVIFGSPKGGTPLMAIAPTLAIDLPLKALVWDDAAGATWVSYNDPAWLAQRHGLAKTDKAATDPRLQAMAQGLAEIAREASGAPAP